jgi:serine/threonine protein kinase
MATVYLAEDIKHKRKVALKVLKPELAAALGAERFVQEITTRRRCSIRTSYRCLLLATPTAFCITSCRSSTARRCATSWRGSVSFP